MSMTSRFMRCLAAVFLLALASSRDSLGTEPGTYGTSAVSYVRVPAVAFIPVTSFWGYETIPNSYQRWIEIEAGRLTAPVSLPSGAKVISLKFEFYDVNPGTSLFASLRTCPSSTDTCVEHPSAGAGPADCLVSGRICSGDAFSSGRGSENADLLPDDITVDNLDESYFLEVTLSDGIPSQRLVGLVVGYVLQVSPPPATATFGDVPTSHPFFQFVEALAKSGITGGCGSGNYCPDAPLTRGQMAVFLAKALGLQWP
jgi:hypothetical protein